MWNLLLPPKLPPIYFAAPLFCPYANRYSLLSPTRINPRRPEAFPRNLLRLGSYLRLNLPRHVPPLVINLHGHEEQGLAAALGFP